MPRRRWVDDTKRRGIPRGVGRGVGIRLREEESSEGEVDNIDVSRGEGVSGDEWISGFEDEDGAIAIAVDIRCAITQPTIFSR